MAGDVRGGATSTEGAFTATTPGGFIINAGARTRLVPSAVGTSGAVQPWRKVWVANITSGFFEPYPTSGTQYSNRLISVASGLCAWIGLRSTVNAGQGYPVPAGHSFEMVIPPHQELWCYSTIAAAGYGHRLDVRVMWQNLDPNWNISVTI